MNFRRTRIFFNYIFNKVDNIFSYTKMCIALIVNFFTKKRKENEQVHIISVICDTYDKYVKKHPQNDKKTDKEFPESREFPKSFESSESLEVPKVSEQMDSDIVLIDIEDLVDFKQENV